MKLEDKYNHFGVNRQEAEYFVNKLKNIYGDMYEIVPKLIKEWC